MAALTFPLALSAFADLLPIERFSLDLTDNGNSLTLGSGEVITTETGAPLWKGRVDFYNVDRATAVKLDALLLLLRRPDASFLMRPEHILRSGLGTGTLNAVSGSRELRIAGLAAGTVLLAGSFVSFVYAGRQAMHQLIAPTTADGAGLTPLVEVHPPIRPGYTIGATVQVAAPRFKAKIPPGGGRPFAHYAKRGQGAGFDFVQTLR